MTDPEHSYLSDFIQSPGNVGGVLAGLAASVLLSFPYGLEGAALPFLATVACEFVVCMFIPDMASFRAWANARKTREYRAESAERVMAQIERRCNKPERARLIHAGYAAIVERVDALLRQAGEKPGALGLDEIERISNVPVEYLSLQLSMLVMDERAGSINLADIVRKLGSIERQIGQPIEGSDTRALTRARDEYQGLINRHQRMMSKRTAIEAAIVSLPDQLAEIYQIVMGEVSDSDNGRLSDAIANLRLRQDIESELNDELSGAIAESMIKKASSTNQVRSGQ
jgi:hypothetical protein